MPLSSAELLERKVWLDRHLAGEDFQTIANDVGVHRTTVMRSVRLLEDMVDPPDRDQFYADKKHIEEWELALERLNHSKKYLCGVVGSDQHFVDHDPTAILLERQIIRHLKPDFSAYNGDVFDFPAIARFELSRRESRQDVLRSVRPFYHRYTEDHLEVRGDMAIIHNSGNHNVRLDSHLAQFWQFSQTIEDEYRDLIRQNGLVVMNDFIEEFLVGPLLIQHGTRTNLHSYKSQAEDVAYGVDVLSGHKHRPGMFYKRQTRGYNQPVKIVTSAVSGCLCRLIPQYASHKTNLADWINGIAVVHVNPALDDSHIQMVNFHPLEDALYAVVGGEVFRQPYTDNEFWWEA